MSDVRCQFFLGFFVLLAARSGLEDFFSLFPKPQGAVTFFPAASTGVSF
jgi:hypothetical protein